MIVYYLLVLFIMSTKISAQDVNTTHGRIIGLRLTVLGQDLDAYYGIPFAKPPIGELRFKYPDPVDPWRPAVLNASTMQPSCHQIISPPVGQPLRVLPDALSEDCLYLNIWAPVNISPPETLATMVWIYGGSFTSGSITLPLYNGRFLAAEQNVIVASVNYRLGAHGFLYLGPDTLPGNQGLMDQALALQWIYKNIENFGGDKNKITIFGESAGAASVGHHLLSPLSRGFFTRAILESGTPIAVWAAVPPAISRQTTKRLAQFANCSTDSDEAMYNCIRLLSPGTVLEVQALTDTVGPTFAPVIDGYFLPDDPSTILRTAMYNHTDILIGVNKDEGTYFLAEVLPTIFPPTDPISVSQSEFHIAANVLSAVAGDTEILPEAIIAQYESTQVASLREPYADIADDILGDQLFKCPAVKMANYVSTWANVYMYSYEHMIESLPLPMWMGVVHSYEIEVVFGHPFGDVLTATPEEIEFSDAVMTYWANFAKSGNPNPPGPSGLEWPRYNVTDERYLVLDVGNNMRVEQGLRKQQCVFWNDLVPLILDTPTDTSSARSGTKVYSFYWTLLVFLPATLGHLETT